MTLPLLISVPHAGLKVPAEVAPLCLLTREQLIKDGDEGAAEIYDLSGEVAACVTTDVPRAIVDMNRAEDDRRADGVVKTHTIWNEPIYREPLTEDCVQALLEIYHRPYHRALTEQSRSGVVLGVDCHTMAPCAPPIGPDAGTPRPHICLSNADGTCPDEYIELLGQCLEHSFDVPVSMNDPFQGGHIIRAHSSELPWVQLEISRAPFMSTERKRECTLQALRTWHARLVSAMD